ncbi:hypothetical protein ABFS82_11G027800 [Erythranthe guttata]
MEFLKSFTSFLTILNESIKLIPRNGKLMAFVAISSLALSSTIFLLFSYSTQYVITDYTNNIMKTFMPDLASFNATDPNPIKPEDALLLADKMNMLTREYFARLLAIQIPFLFTLVVISSFTSISTILVSSVSYTSKKSSLNEVFSIVLNIWRGPMVTVLYVSALAVGYCLFVITLAALLFVYPSVITYWLAISVAILAVFLYLYLLVSWFMAVVASVLEEGCYGFEALVRGENLVKGKKFCGFLINVCFNVVGLIVFWGCKKMVFLGDNKGFPRMMLYGVVSVGVSCLGKIFVDVAYTVLYLQCKVQNGEEIELRRSVHYSKLPTVQLDKEMA